MRIAGPLAAPTAVVASRPDPIDRGFAGVLDQAAVTRERTPARVADDDRAHDAREDRDDRARRNLARDAAEVGAAPAAPAPPPPAPRPVADRPVADRPTAAGRDDRRDVTARGGAAGRDAAAHASKGTDATGPDRAAGTDRATSSISGVAATGAAAAAGTAAAGSNAPAVTATAAGGPAGAPGDAAMTTSPTVPAPAPAATPTPAAAPPRVAATPSAAATAPIAPAATGAALATQLELAASVDPAAAPAAALEDTDDEAAETCGLDATVTMFAPDPAAATTSARTHTAASAPGGADDWRNVEIDAVTDPAATASTNHARIVVGSDDERVVILVAVRHGTVDVAVRTGQDQLASALARSLEELDQALHQHGLALGDMSAGDRRSAPEPAPGRAVRAVRAHRSDAAGDTATSNPAAPVDPRLRALA